MVSIKVKEINKHIVKPIPIKKIKKKVVGAELIGECCCNIALIASTNSGKTTSLFKILQETVTKHSSVIAFASTAYNDDNWLYIKKYFRKKKIDYTPYTSTFEDGVNYVKELEGLLQDEAKERDKLEDEKEDEEGEPNDKISKDTLINKLYRENGVQQYLDEEAKEEEKDKKKKSKYDFPDYVLIFDDVSDELKSKEFFTLLKRARHFRIRNIISTQYLYDMQPDARKSIRVWILFGGMPEDQLLDLHQKIGLKMKPDLFLWMYNTATTPSEKYPYPFFYFCQKEKDFRLNFDRQFIVPPELL